MLFVWFKKSIQFNEIIISITKKSSIYFCLVVAAFNHYLSQNGDILDFSFKVSLGTVPNGILFLICFFVFCILNYCYFDYHQLYTVGRKWLVCVSIIVSKIRVAITMSYQSLQNLFTVVGSRQIHTRWQSAVCVGGWVYVCVYVPDYYGHACVCVWMPCVDVCVCCACVYAPTGVCVCVRAPDYHGHVCVCACVCGCRLCVCVCVCAHGRVLGGGRAHAWAHSCVKLLFRKIWKYYTKKHTRKNTRARARLYAHIHTYTFSHTLTHAHTYTHTSTHTHKHTHTRLLHIKADEPSLGGKENQTIHLKNKT